MTKEERLKTTRIIRKLKLELVKRQRVEAETEQEFVVLMTALRNLEMDLEITQKKRKKLWENIKGES